jgi:hypothetical protein
MNSFNIQLNELLEKYPNNETDQIKDDLKSLIEKFDIKLKIEKAPKPEKVECSKIKADGIKCIFPIKNGEFCGKHQLKEADSEEVKEAKELKSKEVKEAKEAKTTKSKEAKKKVCCRSTCMPHVFQPRN